MHTAEWGSIFSFLKNYYDATGYSHTTKNSALPTGRKIGFAQICSLQICRKNVKTQEYIWSKDGKRHKCSIYHICPRFALQFSEICDIFARSKFVQIHFIVYIDFLDLVVSIGSVTSRCSGKWARTHPPKEPLFREDQRPDLGDGGNRAYSEFFRVVFSSVLYPDPFDNCEQVIYLRIFVNLSIILSHNSLYSVVEGFYFIN